MNAILRVECKNPGIVRHALLPDATRKEDVKISIRTEGKNLVIEITTEKISYLKAIINSYLSIIKTLKELEE